MTGKLSSSKKLETTLSNNKADLEETQPHLSGAYIRSLFKQLTSSTTSRTKDNHVQKSSKNVHVPPQQPHRKQVRRRLHTSRPYQERLLNMAEARREIVAALKFHRASMKQQEAEKQNQVIQQQQQLLTPQLPSFVQQDETIVKSRRNSRVYPSNNGAQSFQNCMENVSYSPFPPPPLPTNFSWNNSPMDVICPDSLDFALPNQPLGLNLNFQGFSSLEGTSLYNHKDQPALSHVTTTDQEENPSSGGCSHAVINDEVMEEIRSIGEQHQMAWDDTMNLVTSAWWFNFLKTMEQDNYNNDDVYHPFGQVMEFPSWINVANETCFQQPLNGYSSEENFQDSPLPCMDIGEIEAMDEEWLS